jgi:hypothetical protein
MSNHFQLQRALWGDERDGCLRRLLMMSSRFLLLPQLHVMSLLILLSIPAIAGILGMAIVITNQVLYPRLKQRPARVIQFPVRTGGRRPYRRAA